MAAGLVFSLSFNLQNDVHRTQVETPVDGLGYRYEITAEPNALCNDGSRAVFYLRPSPRGNSDWLVYFDGGNACYSDASCQSRFITDHSKMSAQTTPADTLERLVGGSRPENSILSADPNVNPYWYDFNTVYVQYCSSDSFLGNISKKDIEWFTPFDFQGANIARGVFKQLVQDHGMHAANNVLLTSVSAGSFGALASGNDIFDYLHDHVPAAKFKVWLDSGFWLLNEPTRPGFAPSNCETTNWVDCRIDGCQSRTKQYFNAVHNRECVAAHPEYTYECAFPEIMWPYIRFPIFVSQQQYDKLQLQGAGLPISDQVDTEAGLAFLLERGDAWREAFKMIDNLWSSNCRKHDIIDKEQVFKMAIKDASTNGIQTTANEAAYRWWKNSEAQGFTNFHMMDSIYYPDANPTCPEN